MKYKVKEFIGSFLEEDINEWFEENPNIKIISIKNSITTIDQIELFIFYVEEGRKEKLENLNKNDENEKN